MVRYFAISLLCIAAAYAQNPKADLSPFVGKPVEVDMSKMLEAIRPVHIHTVPYNCTGKPDHVYARQGTTYYACVNGKDICNEEKNVTIPYRLVERFQEDMREHEARMSEIRAHIGKAEADGKALRERVNRPASLPVSPRLGGSVVTVSRVSESELANGAPRTPLADAQLEAIPVGASRGEVFEKLGDPQMKITGGEIEYLTYMLASGNSAQLELASGKVTRVQVVRGR